jgi:hypothetical protein
MLRIFAKGLHKTYSGKCLQAITLITRVTIMFLNLKFVQDHVISDVKLSLLKKKRFIAKEVCTACSRTSYKTVPVTNLNKYLHNDTSETGVNIN